MAKKKRLAHRNEREIRKEVIKAYKTDNGPCHGPVYFFLPAR